MRSARWERMRRKETAVVASIVFGILSFLVGAYFIAKAGSSNAGSPGGWFLLVLGIVSLLVAFGLVVGAYEE